MGNFNIQLGSKNNSGFLSQEERLTKIQKGTSPYQPSKALPANSPVFVGREEELRRIHLALADKNNPEHISLIGEPRIGKSSLLNQLHECLAIEEKCVCISCNAQGLSDASQQQFFQDLIGDLATGLKQPRPAKNQDFKDFRDYINQLAKFYRFILLLDEFEVLANNVNFDKTFFDNLRSLGDEPRYRFTFFVISHSPLEKLCHRGSIKGSRFWNNFNMRVLGLLEAKDVKQLIACAKESADIAIKVNKSDIRKYCGCHPLLLQKTLHEAALTKVGHLKKDIESLKRNRACIYEMLWLARNKRERALLFSVISDKPIVKNKDSQILHQRGLLVKNKLFCQGFAEAIPTAMIPDTETPESFLMKIKKDPDKAFKSIERSSKFFNSLVKNASNIGKIQAALKGKEPEEESNPE